MKSSTVIKLCLLCYFIIFKYYLIEGQQITFEHYLPSNGLSNSSVRVINQDVNGFLWFGTLNGLNKYDGVTFHKYYHDYENKNSLSSNRIYKLQSDSVNNLWILTYDGNAILYNREKDSFDGILSYLDSAIVKKIHIRDMFVLSKNEIYFKTNNSGCIRVEVDTNSIISVDLFNTGNILSSNRVNFVFKGIEGYTWIGTDKGISVLNSDHKIQFPDYRYKCYCVTDSLYMFGTHRNSIVAYNYITRNISHLKWLDFNSNFPISGIVSKNNSLLITTLGSGFTYYDKNVCKTFKMSNTNSLYSDMVYPGYFDKKNIVWFETGQRGVTRFNPKTLEVSYFSLRAKERETLGETEKIVFFEDSNDDLWLGIYGGGLCKYNRSKNNFNQYLNDASSSESITSNYILTLYEDDCKNLWVGTLNGGVNKIKIDKQGFNLLKPDYKQRTFIENEVRSMCVDSNNNIWIGTKLGKLQCYDIFLNLLYTLPDDVKSLQGIGLKNIYSIMEDHNHNLWIGTKGEGIFILKDIISQVEKRIISQVDYVHIKRNPYSLNTLTSDFVYDLLEVNDSTVWVATHSGGLSVIKDPLGRCMFSNYTEETPENSTISSNILRCLFKDFDGNIWIGSYDGLNLVSKEYVNSPEKKVKIFRSKMGDTSSLNNDDVICIHQDHNGVMYFGTYGGGINYLNYEQIKTQSYKWNKITTKQGLSSNVIYKILEDVDSHELWVSTDYGINKIKTDISETKIYFPEDNSSRKNIFSENTGVHLKNNTFLFGQLDGITSFSPDSVSVNQKEYPIYITEINVNNESIATNISDSKNLNSQKEIELKYFQNFLTFKFAVLDYSDPKKIKYSYILENFDDTWNYSGQSNLANYKRLPSGRYTFKVKGTNSAGVWSNNIAKIDIVILPPVWKTKSAIVGYILIIVMMVFFLRYIILKQWRLKNQVKLEHISTNNKLNFYTNISHELKTPLTLIKGPAEDIVRNTTVNSEVKSKANEILKNTARILDLINQLIDFRKVQNGHVNLSVQKLNITALFQNIHSAFETLAIKEEIHFNYSSVPSEIIGYLDKDKVEKIAFNLISNAFKHTESGKEILLDIQIQDEKLILSVIDKGKGISEEEINHVFERFVLFSKSDKMFNSSSGLGLSLTKELVKLHKGEIKVMSKVGEGSTFIVNLPIDKNCYNQDEILEFEDCQSNEDVQSLHLDKIRQNNENLVKNNRSAGADAPLVLLIEDNEDLKRYLYNNLKSFYKVKTANNGKEGVELAFKYLPDLIISDIMMPYKDGLSITKELKNNINTSHIPIILLTAKSSLEQIQVGYEYGADDYITKPFSFILLKTRVNNLIEQRKKLEFRFGTKEQFNSIENNSTEKNNDLMFISQVTKFIELHMSDPNFTIDSIVSEFNYGRSVFYRKIKTITGYTPTEFVKSVKMEKAGENLISTSKSVSEISTQVGFNDSDYFSRAFKKHYGLTPTNYRQQRKGINNN